jgi:hypothetical protein
MKYLKYYESNYIPSLREKLESIVDMVNYLFDNNLLSDLNGYFGECSVLFSETIEVRSGRKSQRRPYHYDIDHFIKKLDSSYKKEKKLKLIETLYKLSLTNRHSYKESYFEKLFSPLMEFKVFGGKLFSNFSIEKFFSLIWVNSIYKPTYRVEFEISNDILYYTHDEIDKLKVNLSNTKYSPYGRDEELSSTLKDIKSDFFKIYNMFKNEVLKLNLSEFDVEFKDYTTWDNYRKVSIILTEK